MSLEQKRDQFLNEAIPTDLLRAPTTKAAPYPVEALGDVLGNAAKTLQKTVKAPMALCCQSVLAAASLAAQAQAQAHFDIMLPWGGAQTIVIIFAHSCPIR